VDTATAAELKTVLVGARLPAERSDLLEYAVRQRAEPQLLDALRSLSSGRQYRSLDEVVEELLQVQPPRRTAVPHEPKEEAGRPPGGDAYTDKDPDPGAVRP
jgi:hypothetical protein